MNGVAPESAFWGGFEKRAFLGRFIMNRNAARAAKSGLHTVYHGTSGARAKQIAAQGLKADMGGGISKMVGVDELNKGLAFTAPNPDIARTYARQQAGIDFASKFTNDPAKQLEFSRMMMKLPFGPKGKVVKFHVPAEEMARAVRNPEADTIAAAFSPNAKRIFEQDKVFPGGLDQRFVKDVRDSHSNLLGVGGTGTALAGTYYADKKLNDYAKGKVQAAAEARKRKDNAQVTR